MKRKSLTENLMYSRTPKKSIMDSGKMEFLMEGVFCMSHILVFMRVLGKME
jgi:hypothetical protein